MKQVPYKNYDELPLMLSVPKIANVLGISRAGDFNMVRSKGFPRIDIGSRIVVPKKQFIEWINKKLEEKYEFKKRILFS